MGEKSVLLVDDSMFMREFLKQILIDSEFSVIGEASNGMEALERYRELTPDLMIMDITMPKVSGLQALKMIIHEFPKAKIIMCSAMGQESFVADAIKSGACGYILKPFKKEKVVADIIRYWNGYKTNA